MTDLIDRRATAWNRAWIILTGLWLAAIAARLPDVIGAILLVVAIALIAAAVGLVEVSMAIWYRYLQEPARDHRSRRQSRPTHRANETGPADLGAADVIEGVSR